MAFFCPDNESNIFAFKKWAHEIAHTHGHHGVMKFVKYSNLTECTHTHTIPLLWPTVWWLYLCSCKMRKENEILAVRSLEATDWPKQSQQATYPPFCISVAILYAPIKAVHTVAPQVILSIKMWNWDITVTI